MKSIKIFLIILVLSFSSNLLFSQNKPFTVGSAYIDVGAGLTMGNKYYKRMIPVIAKFDIGITDFGQKYGALGLGGLTGFVFIKTFQYDALAFIFGPRLTYHYSNFLKTNYKLDLYSSAFVGSLIFKESGNTPDGIFDYEDYNVLFKYDLKIGAKYLLTRHFGFYAEAGYGTTLIEAGLSFKIR